ncbi:hypothetical protein ANANG_G00234860 [Anguilla anguilla]|uniref:Uncharacterized protein n=1 Tax=Anguilla anguilla TaxID=7936 RepID=A0A9D3RNU7_ANGAN|nr:hypothetical protein ANANG_G00234860 [Anguilla anguilla]
MILGLRPCTSDGMGGERTSHSTQMSTWTEVQREMASLCCTGPKYRMMLLPGTEARKATSTTTVLLRTQEMQSTKLIPNSVWRNIQDQGVGRPMKASAHRKQRESDSSSMKLNSALFALTRGVSRWKKKAARTVVVRTTPETERAARMIPMVSWKDRNSTSFGMQVLKIMVLAHHHG